MNGNNISQPPRQPPLWLKYILGLPQDCTPEELANEWETQIVPLLAAGPQFLWNTEATRLMAAGVPGSKADFIFRKTRRGQQLFNSIEREGRARARAAVKPPFANPSQRKKKTS